MTSLRADRQSTGGLVELLTAERAVPDRLGDPPDDAQLGIVLGAAATVPDHGGLRPWRFAVVRGSGRDRYGDALVAGLVSDRREDLREGMVVKMRDKAFAAPCQVVLIASPQMGSNVPVWEQVASASCTGYAVVLAAVALGLGAIWKSAPVLHTAPVRELFGVGPDERLLGWVNLGTAGRGAREPDGRGAVDLGTLVTVLDGAGQHPLDGGEPPQ